LGARLCVKRGQLVSGKKRTSARELGIRGHYKSALKIYREIGGRKFWVSKTPHVGFDPGGGSFFVIQRSIPDRRGQIEPRWARLGKGVKLGAGRSSHNKEE